VKLLNNHIAHILIVESAYEALKWIAVTQPPFIVQPTLTKSLSCGDLVLNVELADAQHNAIHYICESDNVEMDLGLPHNEEKAENLHDVVGADVNEAHVGMSSYVNTGQTVVRDINKFLERPILIDQQTLPLATAFSYTYKIWDLLSTNERIRNKFEKFAYFMGDIEVNIAISGTPFHYGKILVSYQPYPTANASLQALLQRVSVNPSFMPLLMSYLSQSRACKILDVKDNQPMTIRIPFISYKPMWRLFNDDASVLGSASYDDFENSGSLFVYSLNDINSVSTSPTDVEMTVRAHFVDVKLGTLTGTHYIAESENDETKTGPIEKFFSGSSKVVSKLNAIPEIAPLSVPTSITLKGLAGIASYFGWSKPVLDENRSTLKPDGFHNGMVTTLNDTVKVMGVDKKRSLEVSQGMFGANEDELSLEYLSNRSSLLGTFTWSNSDTPMSSPIARFPVSPGLSTHVNILQDFVQPTPLAFASFPFVYWRGEIVFTLQFVVSNFHRGKIAIVYEPNPSQDSLISASFNLNEQYMKIVDLQEVQNVTFCVPWASDFTWKRTATQYFTDNAVGSYETTNGVLYIVPYTTLQSPDDSVIAVNVFIHGKNMHYAVPYQCTQDRSAYTAEAEIVEASQMYFGFDSKCYELNESTATDDNIHLTNFGEKISSFRSLLKRYHEFGKLIYSAADTYTKANIPIYPRIINNYGDSPFSSVHLLSYLRLAYLGMRGSMRQRVKFSNLRGNLTVDHINVVLNPPKSGSPSYNIGSTLLYNSIPFLGGVTYLTGVNGAVEVDLPFYSNNFWVFSQDSDLTDITMDNTFIKDYFVSVNSLDTAASSTSVTLTMVNEAATGEDFNLHYFTGAPPYNV
jgi:hypothetical protein